VRKLYLREGLSTMDMTDPLGIGTEGPSNSVGSYAVGKRQQAKVRSFAHDR
jgi:hypothetical protein